MGITDRINERAAMLHYSARSMAKALTERGHEVSRGTVNGWLRGERCPAVEYLEPLADLLGTDVQWLVTGKQSSSDLSEDERIILRMARALGPEKSILRLMEPVRVEVKGRRET